MPELIRALRDAQRADPGEWVLGWGLNPNAFGTDRITAEPLIEALGDVPALVVLFDAHSAIATPAALKRAGIDGPRDFDGAAEVVCDERGEPTGHLLELPAYELVPASFRRRARPPAGPGSPTCCARWRPPG